MILPKSGEILITLYLQSQVRYDEVKKRSGLELPPPDNKRHAFEGIPNQGFVYAVAEDYLGSLEIGTRIVFNEPEPKPFKFDGETLLCIKLEQVLSTVST